VGVLEAAAEFNDRERVPLSHVEGDRGAAMLKKWSESHDSRGNGMRNPNEAHVAMAEAFPDGVIVTGEGSSNREVSLKPAVEDLAASGTDLLKQWAKSQRHADAKETANVPPHQDSVQPQAQIQPNENAMVAPATLHLESQPQTNQSLTVAAAISNHTQAFVRAHDALRVLQAEDLPQRLYKPDDKASISFANEHPPQSIASGSDLLAQWSKMHDRKAADETLKSSPESAHVGPSIASQPQVVSIKSDVSNLRASFRSWQHQEVTKEDKLPEHAVKHDTLSLRSSMKDISSSSNHFHQLMHNLEDGLVYDASSRQGDMTAKQGVKMGDDELRHWSLAHKTPSPLYEKTSLAPVASPVNIIRKGQESKAYVDAAVDFEKTLDAQRHSAVHDAMKSVVDNAPDMPPLVSMRAPESVDMKISGADALEQWTKAHTKVASTLFSPPPPSEAFSRTRAYFGSPMSSEQSQPSQMVPDVTDKMKTWQKSPLHDAMRKLTSDTSVVLTGESNSQSSRRSLQADGADALEQWSLSHQVKRYRFMPPLPALFKESPVNAGLIGARSQYHVLPLTSNSETAATKMESETLKWHDSTSHNFMHSFKDETDESEPIASDKSHVPGVAVGKDVLQQWTDSHKAKVFAMPAPVEQLGSAQMAPPKVVEISSEVKAASIVSSEPNWHDTAIHDAMRTIGMGALDANADQLSSPASIKSLKVAGAEALERWSGAHERHSQKFMAPAPDVNGISARPVARTGNSKYSERPSTMNIIESDSKSRIKASVMDLDAAVYHNAMQEIGKGVGESDEAAFANFPEQSHNRPIMSSAMPSPNVAQVTPDAIMQSYSTSGEKGKRFLDGWSKSHDEHKHSAIVDMYPPTPAPETDIMTMALAREANKPSVSGLLTGTSQAIVAHDRLRNMVEDMDGEGKAPVASDVRPQSASAVGSDLLSHWSKVHHQST
jgi:hypothetical protein